MPLCQEVWIHNGGLGLLGGSELQCGGNLALTNASYLWLYGGPTNGIGATASNSILVNVAGTLSTATNCWIYPQSDSINGGSPLFSVGNLTIAAGGGIYADARGFGQLYGPGAGQYSYGGAGHGGGGGIGSGLTLRGPIYDDIDAPIQPGSGGGNPTIGGAGGGLVRVTATGTVSVAGSIMANGESLRGTHGPGGSGGSIFINCLRFEGAPSGLLQAYGGWANINGAPGGGGRIAVIYDTAAQAGHNPRVRFSTTRGYGGFTLAYGKGSDDGTVYLSDVSFLSGGMTNAFQDVYLFIPGLTNWAVNELTLNNCRFVFGPSGTVVTVTNTLNITNYGGFGLRGNASLTCSNLFLSATSSLSMYAGPTNDALDYGLLVTLASSMSIASGSWVYAYSDSTNGGSPLFLIGKDLTIGNGGGFYADGRGFAIANGPGVGTPTYGGGAYGGKGGNGNGGVGGSPYGRTNVPIHAGSGGNVQPGGGNGGGAVRVEAAGTVTLNGTLRANGDPGYTANAGAGAGGSVLLSCGRLVSTASSSLLANGGTGSGYGGGGGGGRIAIWSGINAIDRERMLAGDEAAVAKHLVGTNAADVGFLGTYSVTNGSGYVNTNPVGAQPGSAVFLLFQYPPPGTMLILQ
jgi:hypothetical protein